MNPDQLLNPDLSNTYQFEISCDSNQCDTSFIPGHVTTRATDNPKNTGIIVLPNMITDKMSTRDRNNCIILLWKLLTPALARYTIWGNI